MTTAIDKCRTKIRFALEDGSMEELKAILLNCMEGDTTTVNRLALATLMEAAFVYAKNPPILMSKGAEAVHSEREAELEREMEAQAQRYELQLAECRKKSAERDKLALQVDQLQARLTLLSGAADDAVSDMSYAVRNTLRAIYNSPEGEIRF